MTNPTPASDNLDAGRHPVHEKLWSDPQLAAEEEKVMGSLTEMAADKYRRLFPWAELPEFDAFEAWLTQVGTTLVKFGFSTSNPHQLALRIAAVGPVGGWRLRDEVSGIPRAATPEEIAEFVAAVGLPPVSSPRRRPQ